MSASHTIKFVSEKDMGINPSEDMLTAFKIISQSVDQATWINNVEILDLTDDDKSTIFICDHFEGPSYLHLKNGKYRIFGPRYYIYCHNNDLIADKFEHPCFTATMKGLVICCTNIARDRRIRLHEKIKLMGGKVIRTLTNEATHLVADQVTSKKYHLAAGFKINIYVSEWVDRCWHDGKTEFLHATDPVYDKYFCPIFKGLNITVSQLNAKERAAVKELIEKNGGLYDGCLKVNVTTHLVLNESSGDKYKMAKSKKMFCVNPSWIYDSVKNGFCADELLYVVDKKCEGKDSIMSSKVDRSVNETYLSISSEKSIVNDKNEFDVDFAMLKAAGQFLDGCKIVLIGFNLNTFEVLKNVLNKGGATRFDQINEHVTHVIMGKPADKNNKSVLGSNYRPHVVNVAWLSDSIKAGQTLDENQYSCFKFPEVNALTPFKASQTKTSLILPTESPNNFSLHPEVDADNFTHMVSQYLPPSNINEDESEKRPALFSGLTFGIFGFDNMDFENMEKLILEFGGIVNNNENNLDFGIVPIYNVDISLKVGQLVTYFWLQSCFDNNCICDIMEHSLFSPISFDASQKPLTDCVISTSNYSVNEREIIVNLAELLGAKCQERFSKTTRVNQNLLANTHLITKECKGKKYEGAILWNIPVVTHEWLINCAKMGGKLDEQSFLVGSSNGLGPKCSYITSTPKATPQKLDFSNEINEKSEKTNFSFRASQNKLPQTPTVMKEVMAQLDDSLMESRINNIQERIAVGYKTPTAINSTIKRLKSEDLSRVSLNSSTSDCSPDSPFTPCKPILGNYNGPNHKLRDIRSHLLDSPTKSNRIEASELKSLFFKGVRNALKQDIEEDRSIIPNRKLSLYEEEQSTIEGPLNGVIVVVSKKLEEQQRELNKLAERLGATCRWKYDVKVTHLIHEGKRGEGNKEAIKAESDGKYIVSREWLYACRDRNSRVNEEDYPCTYNSRLALDVSKKISIKTAVDNKMTSPLSKSEPKLSMDSEMIKLLAVAKVAENKRKVKTPNSLKSFFKEGIKKPPSIPRKDAVSEETIQNFESIPVTWGDSTIDHSDFQAKDKSSKKNELTTFEVPDDEHVPVYKPKFHLAGVTNQEKQEFYRIVVSLGGQISRDKDFSSSATHLIAGLPNYTEKYVASVAKGLWVLKKTYLEACQQKNRFVNEEDYEWDANNEYDSESKEHKLAKAAKYWRVKINEMKKNNVGICGAFSDWNVFVLTENQRASSFLRILAAGGAKIVSTKPPFTNLQNVTHAFMELTRVPNTNIDLASLVERNVFCLKFEYITAFLVGERNMIDYLIPEVQHFSHKYNNQSRGKRSSESSPENRRKKKN